MSTADTDRLYPPPNQPMAVARRLIADLYTAGNHRTLAFWRGEWFEWRMSHWAAAPDDLKVKGPLWEYLETRQYVHPDGGIVDWAPTTARVNNLMEPLAILARISPDIDAPQWLTRQPNKPAADQLISLNNGLLDLATKKIHRHTPSLFNTWALPFYYDDTATCPTWDAFLNDVFEHDDNGKAMLQEYAGYLISGRTDLHKALLLIGPTRSGKGTISRTLKQLVGVDNTVSPSLGSIGAEFGMAELIGKPFAVIEDARADDDRRSNTTTERLLNVIGEDAVSINRKNRSYWNGTLPTRFMLVSNETPRFLDASGAITTRFMSVKLRKSFLGKEDEELGVKLNAELAGIFNWALAGLDRLNANGKFTVPNTMTEVTDLMRDLASPMSEFLEQHYEITGKDSDHVLVKEMHARFKSWREDVGGKPLRQDTFCQQVDAADPRVQFKNTAVKDEDGREIAKKARRIFGVKLRKGF